MTRPIFARGMGTSPAGPAGPAGPPGPNGGSLPYILQSKSSAYAATVSDFVRADATSAGFTVTLPTAPAIGALIGVQKSDATANAVTVVPGASGTINGDANAIIVARYAGAIFEHLGSNVWAVVSMFSGSGPRGDAGPAGPAGTGGINPAQAASIVGRWYSSNPASGTGLSPQGMSAGKFVIGMPVIAQRDITIDQLGCYVQTAGAGGSLLRLGIYLPIDQTNPYDITLSAPYAALLNGSDTGTTPISGSATATGPVHFALASPLTIPRGTAFAVGVAAQGGAPSIYVDGFSNQSSAYGNDEIYNGAKLQTSATGFTAALPATYTPTTFGTNGFGGGGHYRRSA